MSKTSNSEFDNADAVSNDSRIARRGFLGATSVAAMGLGMAGGYGGFAMMAGRFLYPVKLEGQKIWLYAARATDFAPGAAISWITPSGAPVTLTRSGNGSSAEDFLALSSVCPHLGCQVFWEPQNDRFFCPCHNGVFNSSGLGIEGPPVGQQLLHYPVKVEEGLIYIEVSTEVLG